MVKTIAVEKGSISTFVAAPGNVISRDELIVSSPVSAQLAQLHVQEGAKIRKGELLANFDVKLSRIQLDKAHAALTLTTQKLVEAQLELRSTQQIFEVGGEALNAVNAAQSRVQIAQHDVLLARAELQQASLQVNLTQITSPLTGTVLAIPVRAPAWVKAGDPLFRVAPLGQYELEAKIDATDSASIIVGKPVSVASDAFVGRQWREKVTWIAPYTNKETTSNSFTVRISLGSEAPPLVLGQQVDVKIMTASKDQVLKIPSAAIISMQGQPMVAMVRQERVHFNPVKIGMGDATHTEITNGIELGQRIILAEGKTLREGDKVKPDLTVTTSP